MIRCHRDVEKDLKLRLLGPEPARFRRSPACFRGLFAHHERDAGSAPRERLEGSRVLTLVYDEFSKTGLCRSTPRMRDVSNSFMESYTSM